MSRTNLILTIGALLGVTVVLGSFVLQGCSGSDQNDEGFAEETETTVSDPSGEGSGEGSGIVNGATYTYYLNSDPRNCPVGQNYEDKCYYATTEASNEGSLVSIVEDIIQIENLEDDPETLGISVIFYHPSGDPLPMAYAFRDDVNGEFDVSLEEPTDPN